MSDGTTTRVTRGFEFRHDHIKAEHGWQALMRVTYATPDKVWYGIIEADGTARGDWSMDRAKFEARFLGAAT